MRRAAGYKREAYLVVLQRRDIMAKYFIAWLLGVPAIVLIIIYLIFGR
jgi:hypothetical protein